MTRILFVCVHNSGRSQMAEAFARHLGVGSLAAESAGTMPGDAINPIVTEAMRERGIDISHHKTKMVTQAMVNRADRVFTMGCTIDETCPATFGPLDDWGLEDPTGKPLPVVRRVRDQVEAKVAALLRELTSVAKPGG